MISEVDAAVEQVGESVTAAITDACGARVVYALSMSDEPEPKGPETDDGPSKKGPPPKPTGPPLPEEIQGALEAAGYPFELRVFSQLKARGMSPAFGLRMRVDETAETRELDIRAHRLTQGSSALFALMQVKRLPEGALVGFLGEPPHKGWMRFQRARCGGTPSFWLSPATENMHGNIMTGDDGLGPAFDRFGVHPSCVQWCVVQRHRDKGRPLMADHPPGVWEDIATLVRAKTWTAFDTSTRHLREPLLHGAVTLYFWFPALVIDAPLYTYEAGTRGLTPVERLTLSVSVDTVNGVAAEYVDVVSLRGLDSLVDDYIAAAADIDVRLTDHIATVLLAVGKRQREHWTKAVATQTTGAPSESD